MKLEEAMQSHARLPEETTSESTSCGGLHSGLAGAAVLEECALGFIMDLMRGSLVQHSTAIQDKLFRLMYIVSTCLLSAQFRFFFLWLVNLSAYKGAHFCSLFDSRIDNKQAADYNI